MPGGSINLDNRIVVEKGFKSKGSLNMAYVSVAKASLPVTLLSFIFPDWDLEKIDDVKYDNETVEDMEMRDKLYYDEAIDNALIASFSQTDKELQIDNSHNEVVYIDEKAKTSLKIGDEIIKANGVLISSVEDYLSVINKLNIGDNLILDIIREKKEMTVKIEVIDLDGEKKTGIIFLTLHDVETNPKVDVKTKSSESGPSGGLMMALSIFDQLTEYDLTQGRKIIGTGTIDTKGNVGEIGGVKYKLLGAIRNNADIFLCPKDNYEEALNVLSENKSDIKLIGVATIGEAIFELSL